MLPNRIKHLDLSCTNGPMYKPKDAEGYWKIIISKSRFYPAVLQVLLPVVKKCDCWNKSLVTEQTSIQNSLLWVAFIMHNHLKLQSESPVVLPRTDHHQNQLFWSFLLSAVTTSNIKETYLFLSGRFGEKSFPLISNNINLLRKIISTQLSSINCLLQRQFILRSDNLFLLTLNENWDELYPVPPKIDFLLKWTHCSCQHSHQLTSFVSRG